MDPERDNYADPESPGYRQMWFDLSVIGWALVLMFLAFVPGLIVAAVLHFGPAE
jgi:hypothetical protein